MLECAFARPRQTPVSTQTTPYLVRAWRLTRMLLHVLHGALILAVRYPRLTNPERAVITRAWARKMLDIFGVRLAIRGDNPGFYPANTLLVANHVSWLDIIALSGGTVSRFVAKREIRTWPAIGWMAANGGTLFIDRSNRRDASRVNGQLAEALEQGGCMSVFPEGTTSDGFGLLPFKSSLFESAVIAGSQVQPVAIRYLDETGALTDKVAFIGEATIAQTLGRLLATRRLTIELVYGQRLQAGAPGLATRFELSAAAREEILAALGLTEERVEAPCDQAADPALAPN